MNKKFKVVVSVGGKFYAFHLAHQLDKHDCLDHLITSYPKYLVKQSGVPSDKIHSILIKEILERSWRKPPSFVRNIYNPQYFISDLFDKNASKKIGKPDIFVSWPSFMLQSLRVAKSRGALIIAEHSSSHVLFQNKILKEEYKKFGVKAEPFQLPHPKIIEKEIQELAEANYISVPSSFVEKTLLEQGIPKEKIIKIPYGVDLSYFKQIPKQDDIFRVVFGGGLSLRKGIPYLLQAFAELNLPNSELLLIGPVNEEIKPFLKKYEGKFKNISYQPIRELHKFYSQGSVFVMPSIEEGLAMVQLQAMACGLPVVCTTNTGGEDIVRDGKDGFVIPIRDVDKLKEKLVYLYDNQDVCKLMGQSAKERVSSGFTWDDYGERIVATYKKILSDRR